MYIARASIIIIIVIRSGILKITAEIRHSRLAASRPALESEKKKQTKPITKKKKKISFIIIRVYGDTRDFSTALAAQTYRRTINIIAQRVRRRLPISYIAVILLFYSSRPLLPSCRRSPVCQCRVSSSAYLLLNICYYISVGGLGILESL